MDVAASSGCKIEVLVEEQTAWVAIIGLASASYASSFVQLIDQVLQSGVTSIVLELKDCSLMDSTFVGHLARLALDGEAKHPGTKRFTLVRPNNDIRNLLDTLYVLDLFLILDTPAEGAPETSSQSTPSSDLATVPEEIEAQKSSRLEMNQYCLDAHLLLQKLHPANREKFKDVVRYLEEDLKRRSTPAA